MLQAPLEGGSFAGGASSPPSCGSVHPPHRRVKNISGGVTILATLQTRYQAVREMPSRLNQAAPAASSTMRKTVPRPKSFTQA